MTRIELTCDATAARECQALQFALVQQAPKAEAVILDEPSLTSKTTLSDTLRVHLHIVRRAPDFVIARLDWVGGPQVKHSTNDHVTGPEVEVATSDTTLNTTALRQLARGLLQVSDLPI